MRSWNGYGGKSGKTGRTAVGLLGYERSSSSLCASRNHTPDGRAFPRLQGGSVVGDPGRDYECAEAAGPDETARPRRLGQVPALGQRFGGVLARRSALEFFACRCCPTCRSLRPKGNRLVTARSRAGVVRKHSAG